MGKQVPSYRPQVKKQPNRFCVLFCGSESGQGYRGDEVLLYVVSAGSLSGTQFMPGLGWLGAGPGSAGCPPPHGLSRAQTTFVASEPRAGGGLSRL